MKRQRVNTVSLMLAMLCAVRGKGLRTRSAFVVSVWQPRVRATKRSLVLGAALGDRHGGLATAHGTTATAHAAHTAQRAHTLHTAQRAHTVHTAQRAHTARWRQGTVRPAAGLGGLGLGGSQRTPLPLPTQSLSPLSTLDRHGSAFSPQHPHEPDLMPVARSPGGHLRTDVKVKLTKAEAKLFATLLEMVKEEKMGTTLRVAGGWVRDKLVGQEQGFHQRHLSKVDKMDIDIALDNCMGGDFATKLSRFLSKKKGGSRTSKVALIASNPDKSKHLETATLRIDNFWVDFVNLRTESYLQDSRIPSINIGTPMEDAFRRDLTINSLFYNVNTGTVEDYTGKGTSDLRLGLVRTPLPPCETLLDDPLRVLRAVRFASRLGFRVHPELMNAGRDPRVHEALCTKVSRERVGCELDQMVRSAAPLRAFQLMDDMDLLPMVFPLPDKFVLPTDDDGPRAYEFGMVYLKNMYHLLDNEQLELDGFNAFRPSNDQPAPPGEAETAPSPTPGARPDVDGGGSGRRLSAIKAKVKAKAKSKGGAKGEATPAAKTKAKANASAKGGGGEGRVQAGTRGGGGGVEEIDEEEMRRLGIYAAFLLPLANSMCQDRKKGTKNVPMIHVMMADCLKLRAKDSERVIQLLSAAMDFQTLVRRPARGPLTRTNKTISLPRLAPGLTLRSVGPLWRVALVLGLTGDLGTRHILSDSARDRADRDEDAAMITAYVTMGQEIESMGLEGVWNMKPMFNGGEVKTILPKIPRGPAFSDVMNEQISWMIDNPGASKEEGREFVQKRFEQFC